MASSPENRRFVSYALTHAGLVRTRNEDAYLERDRLWVVADGMGGHQAGDYASAQIVAALGGLSLSDNLDDLVARVEKELSEVDARLRDHAAAMGLGTVIASTVVTLLTAGDHFACVWAGDSRAYLLRNGALRQLTVDHSKVQEMVRAGLLDPEEAEGHIDAHIVTQAIGGGRLAFGRVGGTTLPGDRFLLCSDGLTNMVEESEIADVLTAATIAAAPQRLVDSVLANGAIDNVTIVIVDVATHPGPVR